MDTKPLLNRHVAVALVTLGFATSSALPAQDMKKTCQQTRSMHLRLIVVKSIHESTAGAAITLQTGETAKLSQNQKDYQSYLVLAQRSAERAHPVGVRIDSAGEIGEISRADNDFVAFLAEEKKDAVKVWFQRHDGIAYLDRQHPRFDHIERCLKRSLKEKKRIWFVWRLPSLTLEDVMIVEGDAKAPGSG